MELIHPHLNEQLKVKRIQSKNQILDPYIEKKKERGEQECGSSAILLTMHTSGFGEILISKFPNCGPLDMYFETLYLVGEKDKNLSYIKLTEEGTSKTDAIKVRTKANLKLKLLRAFYFGLN